MSLHECTVDFNICERHLKVKSFKLTAASWLFPVALSAMRISSSWKPISFKLFTAWIKEGEFSLLKWSFYWNIISVNKYSLITVMLNNEKKKNWSPEVPIRKLLHLLYCTNTTHLHWFVTKAPAKLSNIFCPTLCLLHTTWGSLLSEQRLIKHWTKWVHIMLTAYYCWHLIDTRRTNSEFGFWMVAFSN